ncbi:MAG: nucleotidyltransferase [Erysipelotrichaceae bacterium]|nr:nucleotidyltransferase [Erysipelotrichaceae bacterium]
MKPTLVILAAGMGSRYGGLKQIDTLGDNGESIIDFTIYDAIEAGFQKLVLIIRREHEEAFEEHLVKKIRPFIEVEYAYQDLSDLPEGVSIPEGRQKPWGTTHALLSCRKVLKDDPFIICNADDYYGKDAFRKVMAYFNSEECKPGQYCMVGYKVANTLSDHGTVTRGVCRSENGFLAEIHEVMNIRSNNGQAEFEEDGVYKEMSNDTPVSMNFWGFTPDILPKMEKLFKEEIAAGIEKNPLKYEALLPNHVGELVDKGEATVKILTSEDSWFGVTYKEDKPIVVAKFAQFKADGLYPHDLWAK